MSESLLEKFSRLKHRGLVPELLFQETEPVSERISLFLFKRGKLLGWDSRNFPQFLQGKEIRSLALTNEEEPILFSSLRKGRITLFKVPPRWKKHHLMETECPDMFCLSLPLKYGTRLFGAVLCFKREEFSRQDISRLKEAALCAAEFSVTLPPPASDALTGPPKGLKPEELSKEDHILEDGSGEHKGIRLLEDAEEEGAFLKAQMYARLLINNIKLYNEEDVIVGRMKKDLKIRLKEEIEKAEKLYRSRIPGETRQTEDFFEKELIMNLAGGDRSALGNS